MSMKIALITGISKGIGEALAREFLAQGWFVIGTYIGTAPESQPNLTLVPLDLSSADSIAACVAQIEALGVKLDVFVNNAGILADEEETRVKIDKLRKTLEVNLVGTIDLTERLIPHLASGAHIVHITSTAGSLELATRGVSHFPGHYPAYKISKAAMNMYTVTLARELESSGITVSAVHPGWVKSDIGGQEADFTPAQAAEWMYTFAISHPPTGGYWFKGDRLPW